MGRSVPTTLSAGVRERCGGVRVGRPIPLPPSLRGKGDEVQRASPFEEPLDGAIVACRCWPEIAAGRFAAPRPGARRFQSSGEQSARCACRGRAAARVHQGRSRRHRACCRRTVGRRAGCQIPPGVRGAQLLATSSEIQNPSRAGRGRGGPPHARTSTSLDSRGDRLAAYTPRRVRMRSQAAWVICISGRVASSTSHRSGSAAASSRKPRRTARWNTASSRST